MPRKPILVITSETAAQITPKEYAELVALSDKVTENQTIGSGSRMFRNMLVEMDSRQWALVDTRTYGFHMGNGPDYPINCYRQSFMGWYLPES